MLHEAPSSNIRKKKLFELNQFLLKQRGGRNVAFFGLACLPMMQDGDSQAVKTECGNL